MQPLDAKTKNHMIIMLISLGILFGCIFLYKAFVGVMMRKGIASQSHLVTVSTIEAKYSEWSSEVKAVGSVRTVLGVDITTELAGMIQKIYFKPGAMVKEGDVLVQLNADAEIGQLNAYKANAALAKITYERNKAQYGVHAISKQTVDNDEYNYQSLTAKVAEQQATVDKKTLRAPFSGRLGVSLVNPGQYLNVGDKVVTLQTLDPIYLDFYVPQQQLSQLKVDQAVTIESDAYPKQIFKGVITTVEPIADKTTRNVKIEATVSNKNHLLLPGMFASVNVNTAAPKRYLTLPQSAISFNPYGDIVFLVQKKKNDDGKEELSVTQSFVVTGEKRGDQIAILDGIKEGEVVVTSGQVKLKNGTHIAINNKVVPSNNPSPDLPNEY